MKLRLAEYYSIINEEWDDIESYVPKDMAEELSKFEESHTQEELTKLIQEFIEETDIQFDYPKLLPKYWLEDCHWDVLCKEINIL